MASTPPSHARLTVIRAECVVPLGFGRTREARRPTLADSSPKIPRTTENTTTVWSATDRAARARAFAKLTQRVRLRAYVTEEINLGSKSPFRRHFQQYP